jgi:hypothetical protein
VAGCLPATIEPYGISLLQCTTVAREAATWCMFLEVITTFGTSMVDVGGYLVYLESPITT